MTESRASRSRARSGVAPAITTVILVATTLAIAISAAAFAYNMLELQTQTAEYENGKSTMVSLAEMIEGLAFARGSAAYTTFYMSTGGLELTRGTASITVNVAGSQILGPAPVNVIKLRGGSFVASPDYQILRGDPSKEANESLIMHSGTSAIEPLGWVYAMRQAGAWVIDDFGRVRVVFSGTNNYSINGISWKLYNVVELIYINTTFGSFSGTNTIDVTTKVTRANTSYYKLDGVTSVTVIVTRGAASESYSVPSPSTFKGVPVAGTIVMLSVVDVQVSLAQGGGT